MSRAFDLWQSLDVRQLVSFQTVVATRSFGEAARQLGYTQSAVSQQVAALERTVGHRLLKRSSGRGEVALTSAGELFAQHADGMLARLASARADLDVLAAGDGAAIRAGAFQSVAARILPELITRLGASEQPLEVILTESESELELLALIDEGALDFAFTLLPLDDERYVTLELISDPFYLVGSPSGGHRLEVAELGELAGIPIIAPRSCRTWERIASQFAAAGIAPDYAFRTDDNLTLKGLLQRGIGVAFVSRLTLETLGDDLEVASVDHLIPPRRLALTWARHRTLGPSQRRFVDMTSELASSLPFASSSGTSGRSPGRGLRPASSNA